ncbi:uncharacterized protein LOC102803773 [Saccoglossus kowalevskii]|uniref:G2/mitotic-specific cyclin-B-like n=1 Tax=Saccoglossus kowalevskii TaxID=10224 RepID=A0ABM0MPB6_SACKO|nr:PREDICTED: G2/mitotic-specific cyclin-B-like [Saccoglossus kowalevskii]
MLPSTSQACVQFQPSAVMVGKTARQPLGDVMVNNKLRQIQEGKVLSKFKSRSRIPLRKYVAENKPHIGAKKLPNGRTKMAKRLKKSLSSLSPIKEKNEVQLESLVKLSDLVDECCNAAPSISTNDPFQFPEYLDDIYKYLQHMEKKSCPLNCYWKNKEASCNGVNRTVLLDWLIQVQCHLELLDETLFLTMNLIDKFLTVSSIPLDKLQLLGITCLLIASKIEERYPTEVNNLCFLTAHSYSRRDVLRMEAIVLRKVEFELNFVSPVHFYDLLTAITSETDDQVQPLGRYLMDLSICNNDILNYPPSLRAASALYFSRQIIYENGEQPCWTDSLTAFIGLNEVDMIQCVDIYAQLLLKAPKAKQQAARTKYSSKSRFNSLSLHPILTESRILAAFKTNLSHS